MHWTWEPWVVGAVLLVLVGFGIWRYLVNMAAPYDFDGGGGGQEYVEGVIQQELDYHQEQINQALSDFYDRSLPEQEEPVDYYYAQLAEEDLFWAYDSAVGSEQEQEGKVA